MDSEVLTMDLNLRSCLRIASGEYGKKPLQLVMHFCQRKCLDLQLLCSSINENSLNYKNYKEGCGVYKSFSFGCLPIAIDISKMIGTVPTPNCA